MGKRLVGKHFVEEVLEHDAEACNYLLAVDVDMNTVEGYTMASWSTGYGDFVMKPDLETLRPVPWHEKTAMCMADLAVARRVAGRRVAAADPARPARPPRRARLVGAGGHGARVHRLPRHLRGGVRQGLQGPRARQPVQRRLLDARHLAARAAARADPPRDGGRRPRGGELQGRVQLRPARDQLPLRGRARRRRHARDLQERRQGDRLAGGDGDHVHGQVRRARGQLVPRPLLAARHGRRRRCSPTSPSCSTASWPASSPACAS